MRGSLGNSAHDSGLWSGSFLTARDRESNDGFVRRPALAVNNHALIKQFCKSLDVLGGTAWPKNQTEPFCRLPY
jgi:hypothetical protein